MIRKSVPLALSCALFAYPASAVVLTTGTGDGSVTVGVDGFGSFGSFINGDGTSDAIYDPVGETPAAGTVYQSAVAFGFGNVRPYLTTGAVDGSGIPFDGNATIVNATDTSVTSLFTIGSLSVQLTQTVAPSFDDGERVGSVLNQVYSIQNTSDVANSFDVVRYVDGDLSFDGTIRDGGGRIFENGNEILFETDADTGGSVSTTFLGVTASGGTIPETNRFEVSPYSALAGKIDAGGQLDDIVVPFDDFFFVEGPDDEVVAFNVQSASAVEPVGEFIETAYDVTLALRNEFSLAPNEVAVYQTQTLFGNAVPPAPGSLEALPLLPQSIDDNGAFLFEIDGSTIIPGQTIFFDPVIAIGYTYTVTGAEFDTVTAPSFAAVADTDGFLLSFSFMGVDFEEALASGATIDFSDFSVNGVEVSGLTTFSITGIDPALGLDPANPAAFVTGISFQNINQSVVTLSQTPITADIAPVPVPTPFLLLATALFGLGLFKRGARA